MRISDWSSDVCSSDLLGCAGKGRQGRAGVAPSEHVERLDAHAPQAADIDDLIAEALIFEPSAWSVAALLDNLAAVAPPLRTVPNAGPVGFTLDLEVGAVLSRRAEQRRVGNEWVSKCRFWW